MQRKLLVAIFVILLLIVVTILANLLASGSIRSVTNAPIADDTIKIAKKIADPENWSLKLANLKSSEHFFPVNELYVEIDLEKKKLDAKSSAKKELHASEKKKEANIAKKEIYQLAIDKGDNYSLYCIKQTLSAFPFSYSIVREKDKIQVRIDEKKSEKLLKIADKLKEYDINSVLEKVWL